LLSFSTKLVEMS